MENKGNVDLLRQNYRGMNVAGREKLIQVSEQFLKIWNTVYEEEPSPGEKATGLKLNNEKFV